MAAEKLLCGLQVLSSVPACGTVRIFVLDHGLEGALQGFAVLSFQLPLVNPPDLRRVCICKLPFGSPGAIRSHPPAHSADLGKWFVEKRTLSNLTRAKHALVPEANARVHSKVELASKFKKSSMQALRRNVLRCPNPDPPKVAVRKLYFYGACKANFRA